MPQVRRLTSTQYARVFAGLAIQPAAAALFGYLAFPLIAVSSANGARGGVVDPSAAVSIAAGAGLVALLVTIVGAAPVVASRLDRGPLALRQVLGGGALLGVLPILVIALLASPSAQLVDGSIPRTSIASVHALVVGAAFGLWGAAVFWFIAIWRSALAVDA